MVNELDDVGVRDRVFVGQHLRNHQMDLFGTSTVKLSVDGLDLDRETKGWGNRLMAWGHCAAQTYAPTIKTGRKLHLGEWLLSPRTGRVLR